MWWADGFFVLGGTCTDSVKYHLLSSYIKNQNLLKDRELASHLFSWKNPQVWQHTIPNYQILSLLWPFLIFYNPNLKLIFEAYVTDVYWFAIHSIVRLSSPNQARDGNSDVKNIAVNSLIYWETTSSSITQRWTTYDWPRVQMCNWSTEKLEY